MAITDFERYPLTFGPSPIHPLPRLSAHLGGAQIWAKREDVNSGLAFGGNKTRKLEYFVPDALAQGADTLVSIGGYQSNHTRQVAAVAAKLGLKARLVQENWVDWPDPLSDRVGNILLSRIMGADVRLTGRAVWETITFLLYGFVFILTGLEMPQLLRSLTPSTAIQLVGIGVAVTGVLVAVRVLWIFATAYVPPLLRGQPRTPHLFAHSLVLSWAGMRGVVSLAVALALPLSLPEGGPFPARDALIVVTLTVIVLTLVGQGLTLPWLIRSLRLGADVEVREEEASARQELVQAATRRIDQLYEVWPGHRPLLDRLRDMYRDRSEHVERQRDPSTEGEDRELIEHREIRRTVIDSEREALLRLRTEGAIDDDVMRSLERELDLEEERMDA